MKKSPQPVDKHVGSRVRMRRSMLGISQTKLANGLGITFQQVQKYESGTNRVSASRLQHISSFLEVPIPFFFEGLPRYSNTSKRTADAPSTTYVSDFLATSDGLSLAKAFVQIADAKLRRRIVRLVEAITPKHD